MADLMPTRIRSIRVNDDVWNAARDKADREGVNMTELIRDYLVRYASDDD